MYVSWLYPFPFQCKFISRAQTKPFDRAVRANTEFGDEIHSFRDSTGSKHGFGRDGDLYRSIRRLPFCGWFLNWKNGAPRVDLFRHNRFRGKNLDVSGHSRRSDDWTRLNARTLEGKEQYSGGDGKQRAGHRWYPSQHVGGRLGSHYCIAVGVEGLAYLLIPVTFSPALGARLDVPLDFGYLVGWKLAVEPGD
jgi:hypothetical protein